MCCASVIGMPRKRKTRLSSHALRIASRSAVESGWRISTPEMSAPRPAWNGLTVMLIALLRRFVERFDPEIVDRDAPVDAVFLGRIVTGGAVIGAAVVPDDDVALFPFVVVLGVGRDHARGQFGDQRIALGALDADEID